MRRLSDETRSAVAAALARGVSITDAASAAGISYSAARAIARNGPALRSEVAAPIGPAFPVPVAPGLPYSGTAGPPPNVPPLNWNSDQPRPAPPLAFRPGYHDRSFKSWQAPIGFEGWNLERIRNAIAAHDQGIFLESSLLATVAQRFGPVFAALGQAIAPALALPRHVRSGTTGLARILGAEVEAQLAPRAGLLPSAYFPPTVWGSCAIDLRMMGFAVLQHTYGEPDPETGVCMCYTRRWPTWAVQYYRYRRQFVAITDAGPVDIVSGDGKFTLLADTEEPHFDGAIRALATEVLDGTLVKQARASYVDRYGNPKWIGTMPTGTAVRSPEGDEFFAAMQTIQGPDGVGALPAGAKFDVVGVQSAQNTVFTDALDNVWQFVAAIMLGSDGTMTRGTGVYSAPIFAGVRRDLVDRMLKAMVRGVNMGHVAPWLWMNFGASIDAARAAGEWVDPVLDIPLPDPDGDARIKSYSDRVTAFHTIIAAERSGGFDVTPERVRQLAASLDIDAPTLAPKAAIPAARLELAPTDIARVVRVDEVRASQGLGPIGDDRGALTIGQLDAWTPAGVAPAEAATVDPREANPDNPADALTDEPITEPQSDAAAAKLAEDMTAHGIERCEHGKSNRCRLCGIERTRELVPPSEPGAGDHGWRIVWRPIGGAPTETTDASGEAAEPVDPADAPASEPPEETA